MDGKHLKSMMKTTLLEPKELHGASGFSYYIIYLDEACNYKEVGVYVDLYYKLKVGDPFCHKVRASTLENSNCKSD